MTTDTLTLADFLLARFIDDIALARQVQAQAVTDGIDVDDPRVPALVLARRVLAECDANRRTVDLHDYGYVSRAPGSPVEPVCDVCAESGTWDQWPCLTLKLLALPYADHPDYRQEWRP